MSVKLNSSGGGSVTLQEPTTASNFTLTLPAATATVATTTGTLTNPTINGFTGDTSIINVGSGQLYKDTSGNVGIGTSSPGGYKLNVSGTALVTSSITTNSDLQVNPSGYNLYLRNIGGTNRIDSYNSPITATVPLQLNASLMTFYIADAEKFRFGSSGQLGIGGANYGTSGQVLTSQGSGSAPVWASVSGGVTSLTAGNGITVSASTGAVTVSQDIYTGTSSTNTTYPIGSYVSALIDSAATSTTMNSSRTLYAGSGTVYAPTNLAVGSALTGTWRSRGWTQDSNGNTNYTVFQRTA